MPIAKKYKPLPYSQQPPVEIAPNQEGIADKLVYASSIPGEMWWGQKCGWVPPVVVNTNPPTYGNTVFLGKTIIANHATNTPLGNSNFSVIDPPFTIMIGYRFATLSSFQVMASFAGEGTAGWMLYNDSSTSSPTFTVNGSANKFTDIVHVTGVDYILVATIAASSGQATAYIVRKDTNAITIAAPLTVGVYSTTTQPFALGAGWNTTYQDGFDGNLSTFALWNRVLTKTEALSLLENPYQLWSVPNYEKVISGIAAPMPIISFDYQMTARW